jgi:two-component system nitrate/nitrite response regulator NarL
MQDNKARRMELESENSIRIFIAGGDALFRAGLSRLLDKADVGVIAGEAADGPETAEKITESRPDILVLALRNLGGLEVLRRIATTDMRTVILTAEMREKDLSKALKLGVSGIVLKDSPSDEFIQCIRCVGAGGTWFHKGRGRQVNATSNKSDQTSKNLRFHLTDREMEILTAVAAGNTNKEIARRLSISVQTVKHHLTNIFNKSGASSRVELVHFSIEKKLLDTSHFRVRSTTVEAGARSKSE